MFPPLRKLYLIKAYAIDICNRSRILEVYNRTFCEALEDTNKQNFWLQFYVKLDQPEHGKKEHIYL